MNRRVTSTLTRWHFCPTEGARANLLREGVAPAHCHVTGNTVVDALLGARERARLAPAELPAFAARLGIPDAFAARHLVPGGAPWALMTGHRRESFGEGFERICQAIRRLTEEHPDLGVIYPVHLNPQVQEPVRRLLQDHPRVVLIPPTDYLDFIRLLDRATFVLTDSGGVQEEAPTLGKPVLVLRDSTERPEGVAAGTCVLVGTDPARIVAEAARLLRDPAEYARRAALRNPYGDGQAAGRIRAILEREPL
jgi:UDP-N-acetylglucosamine 2-epimerase (non-hydrolysing)